MKHFVAICIAAIAVPAHAQVISGRAVVVDGDSLAISGTRIRLFGIDAPESRQTCKRNGADWQCGKDAAKRLRSLVSGKAITCEQRAIDRHGRTVASCRAGDLDLARAMVDAGLALSQTDAYAESETRQRSLRIGIWGSEFEMPDAYREAHPLPPPIPPRQASKPKQARTPSGRASEPYSGGCAIKGNRNRKGQWLYHLPGMPYYEATRPEEIFCTEAQAQAAGYQRAKVRQ